MYTVLVCEWLCETGDLSSFLSLQQDPEILGGMIVDLGDKFIDMSTRTKVQKIVKTLSEGL